MKSSVLPNTIIFEGVLDEETKMPELMAAYEKLKAAGVSPPVTLDFSQVTYANSTGIVVWLKFMQEVKTVFKYVNAPVWLVSQFNSIRGFLDHNSFVESFQAPYFAPKSQDSKAICLAIGKDVPVLKDYSEFNFANRAIQGKVYEIDFDPTQYLSFIADNFEAFKENIK
jgi:ABC-type transporter Mla MlaB component